MQPGKAKRDVLRAHRALPLKHSHGLGSVAHSGRCGMDDCARQVAGRVTASGKPFDMHSYGTGAAGATERSRERLARPIQARGIGQIMADGRDSYSLKSSACSASNRAPRRSYMVDRQSYFSPTTLFKSENRKIWTDLPRSAEVFGMER